MSRTLWHQAPDGSEWWIMENVSVIGEYTGLFTVLSGSTGSHSPVGPFHTVDGARSWCDNVAREANDGVL